MSLITDTDALAALCARLADTPFICLDTEFMRESTFWPKLCLVQIAGPDGVASAVDPLADGIDLAPLLDLLNDDLATTRMLRFNANQADTYEKLMRMIGALEHEQLQAYQKEYPEVFPEGPQAPQQD